MVSVYWEDIQIQWYIWKLDSKDEAMKKKAFKLLYEEAKKNLVDTRLKAFFKHPESLRQLNGESLFSVVLTGEFVDLKILLEQGAEVNAKDSDGRTPLHWASLYGIDKKAEILIEHSADVNAKDNDGMTPLDGTIKWPPSHAIVTLLLKHGAMTGAELKEEE